MVVIKERIIIDQNGSIEKIFLRHAKLHKCGTLLNFVCNRSNSLSCDTISLFDWHMNSARLAFFLPISSHIILFILPAEQSRLFYDLFCKAARRPRRASEEVVTTLFATSTLVIGVLAKLYVNHDVCAVDSFGFHVGCCDRERRRY
jgi:hypothetical protein